MISSTLILFYFLSFFIFLILKSLILTCVPKHEPPFHLPPHNISVGHPHAPAPSMLDPASDIDWRFNPYMMVYMLECHSPKSSHPLPLPLSPNRMDWLDLLAVQGTLKSLLQHHSSKATILFPLDLKKKHRIKICALSQQTFFFFNFKIFNSYMRSQT